MFKLLGQRYNESVQQKINTQFEDYTNVAKPS